MKKFNLQSAKFNCGARKSINAFGRLSLNFAICTLLIGAADAAKLCGKKPIETTTADQKLGAACNRTAGFYVYGRNCGGEYETDIGGNSGTNMYLNKTKTDMEWTSWCDEILAVAVSAKGADGYWDVVYLYPYYKNTGRSTNEETNDFNFHSDWACNYMARHG
ncbi:MAG: hypothetical protein LBL46_01365 [Rickettsiales bacterium]|jgi:hypothetical protein|nr:hypothetical protein [Rickettsiales bacterium]